MRWCGGIWIVATGKSWLPSESSPLIGLSRLASSLVQNSLFELHLSLFPEVKMRSKDEGESGNGKM